VQGRLKQANKRTQQQIIDDQHGQNGQPKQPDQLAGLLLRAGFAVKKSMGVAFLLTQYRRRENLFTAGGSNLI
jgi:hypothetical protein